MTKAFETALAQGPAVLVQLYPPSSADAKALVDQARSVADRAAAFLVSDSPMAATTLSSVAGARTLSKEGFETIFTVTCRDRNRLGLMADILGARALGLSNVLVVSGDHPVLGTTPAAKPVFDLDSVQLVEVIGKMNQGLLQNNEPFKPPTDFFIGAVVNPETKWSEPVRIKFRLKAQAGAKFFCSQAVFDPDRFLDLAPVADEMEVKLLAGLRLIGPDEVPEIAAERRPGLHLPESLWNGLESAPEKALELTLAEARQTASRLKGKTGGFVVMAPGLERELPTILSELDLG